MIQPGHGNLGDPHLRMQPILYPFPKLRHVGPVRGTAPPPITAMPQSTTASA